MKFRLFKNSPPSDERVDIYYNKESTLIEQLVNLLESSTVRDSIYGLNERNEQVLLACKDIYYFESVDKRVFAYLHEEVFMAQDNLMNLEHQLKSLGFIRINKSTIVNIFHIVSIKPEINMRIKAVLENNESIIINRSYKKSFEMYLKERRHLHE